jgi:DNA-binding response OmpR family regulator
MPPSAPTVIVLEDDEDIACLLSQLLLSYGTAPLICKTQEAVLEALENQHVILVLLDIMLPAVDGRKVAEMVRARSDEMPLYFMTGVRERDIGQEYVDLSDGILNKPFAINELRSILDDAMKGAAGPVSCSASERETLAIMTTLALEQENIRRQHERLSDLLARFRESATPETQSVMDQFREFSMGLEAGLSRLSSQMEIFRERLGRNNPPFSETS